MTRTIVVGAGVIGLGCAYALRKRGRDVLVIDRGLPGEACSKGNAGWITPSISGPIPAPGLTWTSIKWMLRSDSPLYISPIAAPRLARWLWRFWRYCNPNDFIRGLKALAELNSKTLAGFDQLEREGVPMELHRQGLLFVFADPHYMEKTRHEFEYYKSFGYEMPAPLSAREIQGLEPAVTDEVTSGFLVKEEYHVRPESLAKGYVTKLAELGVEIKTGVEVTGGIKQGQKVTGLDTTAGMLPADEILIAGGAWTGQVVEHFGVELPVQAGKGYSITLDSGTVQLKQPLYLGEARVGCSPFDGGVRFAGTMELSGINTELHQKRIVGIRRGIAKYLTPKVRDDEGTEWVGMRPLTPDGLPMLGRVPGFDNLFVATGHAMLGVTLAPVTGSTMAGLMTGSIPASALAPFEPGRFRW